MAGGMATGTNCPALMPLLCAPPTVMPMRTPEAGMGRVLVTSGSPTMAGRAVAPAGASAPSGSIREEGSGDSIREAESGESVARLGLAPPVTVGSSKFVVGL